jgi:hypothetical protein
MPLNLRRKLHWIHADREERALAVLLLSTTHMVILSLSIYTLIYAVRVSKKAGT